MYKINNAYINGISVPNGSNNAADAIPMSQSTSQIMPLHNASATKTNHVVNNLDLWPITFTARAFPLL
jgi:hypothetical protein